MWFKAGTSRPLWHRAEMKTNAQVCQQKLIRQFCIRKQRWVTVLNHWHTGHVWERRKQLRLCHMSSSSVCVCVRMWGRQAATQKDRCPLSRLQRETCCLSCDKCVCVCVCPPLPFKDWFITSLSFKDQRVTHSFILSVSSCSSRFLLVQLHYQILYWQTCFLHK